MERHLAFAGGSGRNEVAVEDVEDVVADVGQLGLNLDTVFLRNEYEGKREVGDEDEANLDLCDMAFVALRLFLLFDGRDNAPGSAASADDVLVCDRQQVALFNGELDIKTSNLLH